MALGRILLHVKVDEWSSSRKLPGSSQSHLVLKWKKTIEFIFKKILMCLLPWWLDSVGERVRVIFDLSIARRVFFSNSFSDYCLSFEKEKENPKIKKPTQTSFYNKISRERKCSWWKYPLAMPRSRVKAYKSSIKKNYFWDQTIFFLVILFSI